ncbi:unnamed protein product [Euphydryas editha]|uniref:Reverse transcriptase domain-containing protein n=1 Tax=Euphydryas editha TaxID=104508 RepID=A0AAU9V5Z7_EUPED|nr:unnamed protein product [Euphydryas editha]
MKVSPSEVEKVINMLSSKKSPGIDGIRVQDIKYLRKQISPILANFINMCLTKGLYPDQLKSAIIRPIYKSGSHLEYVNYRPIAILSVIDKIVEKIVVGQITKFLETHNILTDSQHGFRKGRSTVSALSSFAEYVNEALDSGEQLIAIFIDYKKAFDTLDHNILLQAMHECGIRGPTNNWFRSYLSNRKIRTLINGVTGEDAAVSSGVPTGSVFGPVGYVMHVNSVANVVSNCQVFMYADDMCVVSRSKDISIVQKNVQSDFDNITKWAHDNGIILNFNKTKCMHIHSPYNKTAKNINRDNLTIIGHTYECLHKHKHNCNCIMLQYETNFKYLGLNIEKHFNWAMHVSDVCNRLRSVLGKFYQLRRVLHLDTLKVVYYALADSLISYGLIVYGRTFKSYIKDIKNLQIRLVKYLVTKKVKAACNKDYDKLFPICKILPIEKKVEYLIGLEYYYSNEYKEIVYNKYNTRRVREQKLKNVKVRNYYGKRTNKYLVPHVINKTDILRQTPKIHKIGLLKNKLKKILLDIM